MKGGEAFTVKVSHGFWAENPVETDEECETALMLTGAIQFALT